MRLDDVLRRARKATPSAVAATGPDGVATYAELDSASDRVASALVALDVRPGDRVAVWLPKSVRALAALQGALRVGAAYVPCDPTSPPARVRKVLEDCQVRALVASSNLAGSLGKSPPCVTLDSEDAHCSELGLTPLPQLPAGSEEDLAYVLYTSGSTGTPKGVCISHRAALAFVNWAAGAIDGCSEDRFANHAPLHFDLSVLDVYAAWWAGARVVIVPEGAAYDARRLVELVVREQISIWYSVPSALSLMIDRGDLLSRAPSSLRAVLFAGEPFPIKYVRALSKALPHARLWNLYGPTETNVCTAYEVREVSPDRVDPVPIGGAVCGDLARAEDANGEEVGQGEIGELVVSGPTLMSGYFGHEPLGGRPYRTGDLVRRIADESYEYVGRRDQMVKLRGHRVELGEVEVALDQHDAVREAAVIVSGEGISARLVAFVAARGQSPSLLALKRHLAERLPRYMIIDQLNLVGELPRTGNGKIDRARLRMMATTEEA